MFIGSTRFSLDEVDSTNAYIQRLLQDRFLPEGTVVSAKIQNIGRGQMGTIWESGKGTDITLSLVLYPVFLQLSEQFSLSEAIALGVYKALMSILPNYAWAIKWPNDILLEGEKICGILIENAIQGSQIKNSIIGIGVNVNQDMAAHAQRTSFKTKAGKYFDINEIENILFTWLEHYYLMLRAGKRQHIHIEYISKLLGYNEIRYYRKTDNEELFAGTIIDVNHNGKLNMLVNEEILAFDLKEIKFLFPDESPSL